MAGEGVTAMIVAADAGDNPLADRREDRKAAAERERKAKVAKVASQATNAMAAVRAQLDLLACGRRGQQTRRRIKPTKTRGRR